MEYKKFEKFISVEILLHLGFLGFFFCDFVSALQFLIERPVDEGEKNVAAKENNPMVQSQSGFQKAHFYEHDWACDEEQWELSALILQ